MKDLASAQGLAVLGGFAAAPEHGAPQPVASIALLGFAEDGWDVFAASPEARDGAPDPLDRWSHRVVEGLADALDAVAFFPFGGPPYHPFLRWAEATGRIWPSPVGMSIHDERGLWVAFRGALGFRDARPDLIRKDAEKPCDTCAGKPCLRACPVEAFATGTYDVPACVGHIASEAGADCLNRGCLVRRACPVGTSWTPAPNRAAFHMRAFKRARESA